MSYRHGTAFGWPIWGELLFMIPIGFVIGVLTGHTPTSGFIHNRVVLLGALGLAALGNLWPLVHAEVLKDKPPTLRIDIAGNPLSMIVLAVAGLLGALLIGSACQRLQAEIGL